MTYQHLGVVSRGQKEGHARTGRGAVSEQSRRKPPHKLWEVFNPDPFSIAMLQVVYRRVTTCSSPVFFPKQRFHMISSGVFPLISRGFSLVSCGVFRWPSKNAPFVAHFVHHPSRPEHQERLERQVLPIHRGRRWGFDLNKGSGGSTRLWLF